MTFKYALITEMCIRDRVGILYNMEILESAGWDRIPVTFQELESLCEDVKAAQKKVFINSYMNTSKMIESGLMQMVSRCV